tara:strand:+ start:41 stop:820 length:780 start_codon:yes stop_codon:yes gene_type:complete
MINKKKVLIVGIESLIGSHIKRKFSKKFKIYGTSYKKNKLNKKTFFLNLKNPNLNIIKKKKFDIILMCAGKNNLKYCQKNYKKAYKINYIGIKKIFEKAIKENIFIVFISSNVVFSGKKKFYKVSDKPSPKSNYGKLKLRIENFLKKQPKRSFCILRLTKIYSKNVGIIYNWKKKMNLKQKIHLNCSFKISPLAIENISKYLFKIIIKKKNGIYHLSNKKEFTLKEFLNEKIGEYKNLVINYNSHKWQNKHNSLKIKLP